MFFFRRRSIPTLDDIRDYFDVWKDKEEEYEKKKKEEEDQKKRNRTPSFGYQSYYQIDTREIPCSKCTELEKRISLLEEKLTK